LKRALVAYLDNAPHLVLQSKALVESLKYVKPDDTDLIIFGPEVALNKIPDHKFVIKIIQDQHKLGRKYGYINSIACLCGPGSQILNQYDYLLKTDLDVFITPAWNNFRPEEFTVGQGAYSNSQEIRENCKKIAEMFGFVHQGQHNIGSTFYGPASLVRNICRLATMLCEYLLLEEFWNNPGEWPEWFEGVSSMYATEIAINHLVPNLKLDTKLQLDGHSTSLGSVDDHPHIHCWHTNERFSKFEWEGGRYDSIDPQTLDLNVIRDYCTALALRAKLQ
jgi:hypothetical protein